MSKQIYLLVGLLLGLLSACQFWSETQSPSDEVISNHANTPEAILAALEVLPEVSTQIISEEENLSSLQLLPSWTPNGPTVTPFPTSTPYNTPEPSPTLRLMPTADITYDLQSEHFWLARPFLNNSGIQTSVNAYAYGTTTFGYQPHHGVDIENPIGTNVRAVAHGRVFYAGDDLNDAIFGPQANFYGNLVVIEHEVELPDSGKPFTFYTLYGHLSQFFVREGMEVEQFDEIGAVGQEGVAIGPHLHLEVRIGDPYDYGATYNPNLWLQPYLGFGVLAGRVLYRDGGYVPDVEIEVRTPNSGRVLKTTLTYHYDLVNKDPYFLENFVVPDLQAGNYEVVVKYQGRAYTQPVEILPGRVTMVNQVVN
ncbi:MAG: hypothetical protein CUN55_04260 [Phototrophicales bacterium]|nr:MAG: hypothetical protein CUN55_04260 [Phototrophicales bacterium]